MVEPKYIVNLKGKQFVLWAGLLDAATRAGLKSIEVKLLQHPAPENGHLAISEATVVFEDGRLFTEIGDAGPENCTAMIAPHACRMSATRAKGRALRDALNISETMYEELGAEATGEGHGAERAASGAEQGPREGRVQNAPQKVRAKHDPQDHAARTGPGNGEMAPCVECGVAVPAPVAKASIGRFGVVYCIPHGKNQKTAQEQAVNDCQARMEKDQQAFAKSVQEVISGK